MSKDNKSDTSKEFIRAPIVTVMGHVDHGKTSILDALRKTRVQAGEFGGITQHIGAYQLVHNSHKITFIDTPGHAAFAQMRARGGRAADIVVLVVAANDGVKPQTKEAIAHAQAAGVPIVVAINKMDLASADAQKVKQELAQEGVLVEGWGGDVVCVEVSAKTGENLASLLDAVLVIAELLELKASPTNELEAIIIESKRDRRRGVVVSCIVKNGTLRVGTEICTTKYVAKVKSLVDDKGNSLQEATPSTPVELLGFKQAPNVGDLIVEKGSELIELVEDICKQEIVGQNTKHVVAVIVRADTQGTLEAVKAGLAKLVSESVGATFSLKFLLCDTGDITDSDVLLAQSSRGVIVGFNVRISTAVKELAQNLSVPLKSYKTIYELIDEAQDLLEGTAFEEESKIKGRAQILKTFKLPSGDVIAGCLVLAGALKEGSKVSIYAKNPADVTEDDIPLYTGVIKLLHKGKEQVKLVGKDNECGVFLKPQFDDLKKDLFIEVV